MRRFGTSPESANLDFLRSAAVFCVVVFHLALFFGASKPPGSVTADLFRWGALGHWGVLMFFVHTCLVLMQSLERLQIRGSVGRSLYVTFIVRRCFRLLPLSALTVAFVWLFRLPVGHLHSGVFFAVPMRAAQVVANLILVQDLANVESIEAPLWSLPLEMQMYLVLPILFVFVRDQRTAYRSVALWAAACAVAMGCEHYHYAGEMPAYVPCFVAGIVAYRMPKRGRPLAFWLWPLALAAISLLYVRHPSVVIGWVCCLAMGLAIPQFAEMPAGAAQRMFHYIARYSYGIYLWHFVLIWFAFVRLGALPLAARVAVFLVLLVAVPTALYHCVEAPMIRVGAAIADRVSVQPARLLWTAGGVTTVVVVALTLVLRVAAAQQPFVLGLARTEGDHAAVNVIGRFDWRDAKGPKFAWPGSAIAADFEGTGIDILLHDSGTNYFSVVVDNERPRLLPTFEGTHEYPLASNLRGGPHRVVLLKRTEAHVGTVQYLGVMPHGGSLVASARMTSDRQIEVVGDSIACGYGILGPNAACPFSPDTEDESTGFPALTADAVGARTTVIAYSGKGMYRDYIGKTEQQVPVLFLRTLPDDPTSVWNFQDRAPDVVVIALGTNDYALGDPGPAFGRTYASFLRLVRDHYPTARMICTLSPTLVDSNPDGVRRRTAAAAAILGVVNEVRAAGDERIEFLAFDEQTADAGRGCDDHPSAVTHRRMAMKLTDRLRQVMGW